jgi:hypothetical protein
VKQSRGYTQTKTSASTTRHVRGLRELEGIKSRKKVNLSEVHTLAARLLLLPNLRFPSVSPNPTVLWFLESFGAVCEQRRGMYIYFSTCQVATKLLN